MSTTCTHTDASKTTIDQDTIHTQLTRQLIHIVKSIKRTSQRKATNVGKPSQVLVNLLKEEYDFDLDRMLMVGDRLDTDVKFGKDGGMKSALVLIGCTAVDKLMDVDGSSGMNDVDGDVTVESLPHIIFSHMGMMPGPKK